MRIKSIYGWRGQYAKYFGLRKDYPDAAVILLEQNYRSTSDDFECCESESSKTTATVQTKNLWTENRAGEKITYYRGDSERDEARFIVSEMQNKLQIEDVNSATFAVLYRTNAQSRVIEEMLLKANVPYTMVGGRKFYDRKEIRDILRIFRPLAT